MLDISKSNEYTVKEKAILIEGLNSLKLYCNMLNRDYWVNSKKEVINIKGNTNNNYLLNITNILFKRFSADEVFDSLLYETISRQYMINALKMYM